MGTYYEPSMSGYGALSVVASDIYYQTQLSIALSANQVMLGDPMTISGILKFFPGTVGQALAGQTIKILAITPNNQAFVQIGTVVTGSNGSFSFSYTPPYVGDYTIYLVYEGTGGGGGGTDAYPGLAASQAGISISSF
jgi:hypothetical protein